MIKWYFYQLNPLWSQMWSPDWLICNFCKAKVLGNEINTLPIISTFPSSTKDLREITWQTHVKTTGWTIFNNLKRKYKWYKQSLKSVLLKVCFRSQKHWCTESQASSQTHWIRIWVLTKFQGDLYKHRLIKQSSRISFTSACSSASWYHLCKDDKDKPKCLWTNF